MKKHVILLPIAATVFGMAGTPAAEMKKPLAMEGVGYIKMLGKELKGEMKKYMKQDPSGLQAAYFCSKSAEELTKKVNAKYPEGVRVYRTALKYRNPANKPDATDMKVMEQMEATMKAGTFKKKPVIVKVDGKERVYVPLIVEKVCLKCHGPADKINPQIKETIAKHYPHDMATGFTEGTLRGVIVAELPAKAEAK